MIPAPVRTSGVVKSWNVERGFGFAAPATGGPDVFVHISAFPSGSAPPQPGDTVTFEVAFSPEGKPRARNVVSSRPLEMTDRRFGQTAPRSSTQWSRRPRSGPLGFLAIIGFVGIYALVNYIAPLPPWVLVLYLLTSTAAFIAYAVDKSAARHGRWRVSENALLAFGLFGGWPGAILAQQFFRHKTVKPYFRRLFWVTVIVNVLFFVIFSWLTRDLR